MHRKQWNFAIDWLLLAAFVATAASGLVLLLHFHVGGGIGHTEAFGLSRSLWNGLHRVAATIVLAAGVAHVVLHWKPLKSRVAAAFTRTGRQHRTEALLYASFVVSVGTGFAACFAGLAGSLPPGEAGQAVLPSAAQLAGAPHSLVDLHLVSSLLLSLLAVHHTRHRWQALTSRPASR